eukprot:Tbor_TRINITY_DN5812_c0_g1::TRINITY_DN5812_c0_g1_i4::g.6354::m.6354/K15014/SLC29A1_2_3, ENT1_2_3; solute carrier family 29 (equilibrative nucleoside transporter), member 1/2/3
MAVCFGLFESRSEVFALIITLSLGFSHLFAYNAILSTPGYFMNFYKYLANDEFAESSYPLFWKHVVATLSVCGVVPNLATQLIMVTPVGKMFRNLPKMYFGLIGMATVMVSIPLLTVGNISEGGAIATLLIILCSCSSLGAIYQNTTFGFLSTFPPRFMTCYIMSIHMSGVISTLLSLIIKCTLPLNYIGERTQGIIFFILSGCILVVGTLSLFVFRFNKFAQRHVIEFQKPQTDNFGAVDDVKSENAPDAPVPCSIGTPSRADVWRVMKATKREVFITFITFAITLTVYPGVVISINPTGQNGFYPFAVLIMYNVGDTIGALSTFTPRIWIPIKYAPYCALLRVLFIPLFFFCIKPAWISGDEFPIFLTLLHGLTNGYFATIGFVYGPNAPGIEKEEDKVLCGNIMSLACLSGLSTGSCLGLIISYLVL